jgi:hypothetical protein
VDTSIINAGLLGASLMMPNGEGIPPNQLA